MENLSINLFRLRARFVNRLASFSVSLNFVYLSGEELGSSLSGKMTGVLRESEGVRKWKTRGDGGLDELFSFLFAAEKRG